VEDSRITVVIPTRNRGAGIVPTVQSILRSEYADYKLRIVDQSDSDLTETSLQPYLDDPRVQYVRIPGKGVSIGRNLGVQGAQSELIAATDDDCEVPGNWLRELVAGFAMDRRIGIVFGNVLAGPHNPKAGFVMAYVRKEPYLARSLRAKHRVEGVAACMGLRKSAWEKLSGFDEMLGKGARFKSAEETDLAIRALLAGIYVYETPRAAVVHKGSHTWEQSPTLFHGYLYGIGAMLAKNLKCGHPSILWLLAQLAWRWAFQGPAVEFGFLPPRWPRLAAFLEGLRDGAATPVNRATGHFSGQRGPIAKT
jgi:GT2 family glycosyltransferase